MTNIYLDENLSEHVALALNALNKGYFRDVQVISTKERFGKGARDEDIIPLIGAENGVLITRDFNIRRTKLQFDLCSGYGIGVFFLTLPKGQSKHWDLVKALINQWEAVIDKVETDAKPYAYRVRGGRMQRM